jgi:hypothetical protein
MHQKFAGLHFNVLKHPAYSTDWPPSDYCICPNLKKQLEGRNFSSIKEAALSADGGFAENRKNSSWMG